MLENHKSLSHAGMYARYLLNTYLKNKDILAEINYTKMKNINKPEFEAWSKEVTSTLAHKLAAECAYDLSKTEERATNFLSAILIQLEQNPELLVG